MSRGELDEARFSGTCPGTPWKSSAPLVVLCSGAVGVCILALFCFITDFLRRGSAGLFPFLVIQQRSVLKRLLHLCLACITGETDGEFTVDTGVFILVVIN